MMICILFQREVNVFELFLHCRMKSPVYFSVVSYLFTQLDTDVDSKN
jgi:hypothetical protein